jgi:hypothetical protein
MPPLSGLARLCYERGGFLMLSEFQSADSWKLGWGPDLAWIRAMYPVSKRRRRRAHSPDGRRMAETENTGSGRKPDQQVPGSKTRP